MCAQSGYNAMLCKASKCSWLMWKKFERITRDIWYFNLSAHFNSARETQQLCVDRQIQAAPCCSCIGLKFCSTLLPFTLEGKRVRKVLSNHDSTFLSLIWISYGDLHDKKVSSKRTIGVWHFTMEATKRWNEWNQLCCRRFWSDVEEVQTHITSGLLPTFSDESKNYIVCSLEEMCSHSGSLFPESPHAHARVLLYERESLL